jgi:murein L,D-transpeptidase YcbB/YkuD
VFLLFLAVLAGLTTGSCAQDVIASDAIRDRIARLDQTGKLAVGGTTVTSRDLLTRFYEVFFYGRAWQDPRAVDALMAGIAESYDHGLNPEDYHATQLKEMAAAPNADADSQADFDILLSDAAVRLLSHLWFGKVDPGNLDQHWNLKRPFLGGDPVEIIAAALANGQMGGLIQSAQIDEPYYLTLKSALKSYREIASSGGWPMVPEGETLKPGMSDPRVPVLRKRLTRSGDYNGVSGTAAAKPATGQPAGSAVIESAAAAETVGTAASPDGRLAAPSPDLVYDEALVDAVKSFQQRHGIEVDGILGPNTLAAMNVTVDQRIDQIRVNLERARWVLRNLGPDYIVVNIAGFYVDVIRSGEEVWHSRTIVGQTVHETPVFRDELSYIVFNPTWTAPASIVRNELIPAQRKNPSYLRRNNFVLIDSAGRRLSPGAVNWARVSAGNFPYQVVQQPGDDNALGRVKFVFPNQHAVYMHDTPSRSLFGKAQRAFSHGCIRVQDPLGLAELLLKDQPDWTPQRIADVLASGKTTQVAVKQPLPVLLLYWTVDPDPAGNVRFYTDIYDRDAAVLAALDQK